MNREKVLIFGKTRERLYLISILVPAIAAIVVATIGFFYYVDFWPRLLIYQNNPEGNAQICQEVINLGSYLSILNQFRLYLSGFEVAMLISLSGIGARGFYLKKKTNAYFTLARLPKGKRYKAQIYMAPIFSALVFYLIRFAYILVYMCLLARVEGSEQLVKVMMVNIWRILL